MSTSRNSGRPSRRAVFRDVSTFVLGWVLIFQQAVFVDPAKVNEVFIWAALALLGVPGASQLFDRIGTALRPSVPAPPVLPAPVISPATSTDGGD